NLVLEDHKLNQLSFKMIINEDPTISETTVPKYNGPLDRSNPTREMIFELIRYIKDPEHPYSLEQLKVVEIGNVSVENIITKYGTEITIIEVIFIPTVPHCSMASIIGLSILKILRYFFRQQYIKVMIKEDTHMEYQTINKQLNDKDRVLAAFENSSIMELIEECVTVME
ncbi:hypothetical protein M153_20215000638, partial [Pseudoloma neurophilia]